MFYFIIYNTTRFFGNLAREGDTFNINCHIILPCGKDKNKSGNKQEKERKLARFI